MPAVHPATPKRLAIFRAGRHTAVDGRALEFSQADLQAIASGYDPAVSEAPIVIGHPALNAPAFGWVRKLEVEGDTLFAEADQVEPAFAELVNAGRYKKISASLYLADSPGNPKPGTAYLRHVGFLGAQPPAVKGLPSAAFAAPDALTVEFADGGSAIASTVAGLFRRLREHLIETKGLGKAEAVLPSDDLASLDAAGNDADDVTGADADAVPQFAASRTRTLETSMDAAKAAELAARETTLKTREEELARRETAARRADAGEFAEGLVKAGKLLPRQKAPIVELMLALPAAPISFAEGAQTVTKEPAELLRAFLGELPKQVDFQEKSGGTTEAAPASFAAPAGSQVDATRMELFQRATAYQRANPNTDFKSAVRAVGG